MNCLYYAEYKQLYMHAELLYIQENEENLFRKIP